MYLDGLLRGITDKFIRRRLPRIVTIKTFVPAGCQFEISTPVEAYRVECFGGEKIFTKKILSELTPSDVLFDIGACVGMVSVHAAKKGVHVVAFEPDPGYYSRLKTNLRLNGLDQVHVVPWAVSDKPGETVLYTDGVGGNSPSLRKVGDRGSVTVRTDTIDLALSRDEFPPPTVIKIDIEGAEILALRGLTRLLQSKTAPRAIFIETHPQFLPLFGSSEAEVMRLLESFRYIQKYKSQREGQMHYMYWRDKQAALI